MLVLSMFNIYRVLFLALEKVLIFKITHRQQASPPN